MNWTTFLRTLACITVPWCFALPTSAADTNKVQTAAVVVPAATATIPAGAYKLDRAHASLLFRVSHLGFSNFTARFKRFDAQLQFDPENLAAASVTATVEVASLETDYPDPAKLDFNAKLTGPEWLDAAKFPQMTFESRRVEVTGRDTVRIHGDLRLRGVTRPVVLDAKFNGGYADTPWIPMRASGSQPSGTLLRSEFGISYGIPAPGTTMGVSDAVDVIIEAEFTGPPLAR